MRRDKRIGARGQGFSLIEMLIASFLLLLIVVGLLPLFVQSIKSNKSAEETSDVLRAAQLQMEGLVQLRFDDPRITVADGEAQTSHGSIHPTTSYQLLGESLLPLDDTRYNQPVSTTVTIRHFNIAAIDDGVIDENDALDAGAGANLVHFKQIVMEVERPEFSMGLPIGKSEIEMIKAN